MKTNAKITNINPAKSDDYRKSGKRFTVYTDGVARDIADQEYFTKYNIINFDFRCASWSRVGSFAAAIEARRAQQAVETAFGVKVSLKFSRTAGCSCGCSPGFVGEILEGERSASYNGVQLSRASIWMEVPLTDEEKQAIVDYAAKQAAKLPAEIEAGKAKVAAEQAAKAAAEAARQAKREATRQYWAERERQWAQKNADASLESANL